MLKGNRSTISQAVSSSAAWFEQVNDTTKEQIKARFILDFTYASASFSMQWSSYAWSACPKNFQPFLLVVTGTSLIKVTITAAPKFSRYGILQMDSTHSRGQPSCVCIREVKSKYNPGLRPHDWSTGELDVTLWPSTHDQGRQHFFSCIPAVQLLSKARHGDPTVDM